MAALYDELGSPCTQCGRRFKTDAESKKKKMAHMDWHFRVHQRSTETERRGTHRSWYVDQQVSLVQMVPCGCLHVTDSETRIG